MIFSKLIKFVSAGLLASVVFLASASIPAGASPKITVLAFGLFGAQSVFESEAKGAASIVAHRMGADPVVVRANTKTRGEVTSRRSETYCNPPPNGWTAKATSYF
jgi:hypothetical protein